jgi:hypothetical protein
MVSQRRNALRTGYARVEQGRKRRAARFGGGTNNRWVTGLSGREVANLSLRTVECTVTSSGDWARAKMWSSTVSEAR